MADAGRAAEPLGPLVAFGRELRARGLPVGTGGILTFVRAVAALGLTDRRSLYWAGRISMIGRKEDLAAYDLAFEAWYRSLRPEVLDVDLEVPALLRRVRDQGDEVEGLEVRAGPVAAEWHGLDEDDEQPGPGDEAATRIVASAVEVLRSKSFADLSQEEREEVGRLIRALAVALPEQRIRRTRPSPKGGRFDVRRTLRRSLRTRGEPFERAWRDRRVRGRPLVLILDVSGSMSPYARALVQFGYAAMAAGRSVEVFCFGTRLTRVTRTLRMKDPDRAMREIGQTVADWEGGTRIGGSLKSLLDGWNQRAALRGAVVVLCSDGLERGDPELLRGQMVRLGRLAHKVVWVNPLKGSPRYEPLARGMAAALPSIDVFMSGHNLESITELSRTLAG
ncbi:MAG TPA: VWA domain-containing protein [Actinomycetota bacterium]|nr:VWA domain-containing protein [Actinomycetota bacterium]